MKTIRAQKHWIQWQIEKLREDLKYCHPRWVQEEKTIRLEIKRIKKLQRFSGTDAWFYYDWVVVVAMLVTIVAHFVFYKINTNDTRYIYTRILSVVNLLVWLRLLKYVRPFPGIGTLVIILGATIGDFVNWAFLFFLLFIPFSAAFWIIFGGVSTQPVPGYDRTEHLLYSMFQMAVGDNFNFDGLAEAEPAMSRILTFLYLTTTTIVILNLLIALLSQTFSRVYINAVANTIMQRAIKVIEAERTLSKKSKRTYKEHVKANCSPETIKSAIINADQSERTKKDSDFQSDLMDLKGVLDDRFAKSYGKNKTSDFDKIKQDVRDLEKCQKRLLQDLTVILEILKRELGNDTKMKMSSVPRSSSGSTWRVLFQEETDGERRHRKKQVRKKNDRREKHGERDKSGNKERKRGAKNKSQGSHKARDTSIVPFRFLEKNREDNEDTGYDKESFQANTISDFSDWEAISLDSITL